jgi:hypothetical protein
MANTMQSDVKQTGSGAAEVASTAKDRAAEVSGAAGAEVKAVAQDAAAHARQLVDETRGQLRTQASEQTDRLTGTLRDVAAQLQSMAEGRGAATGVVGDVTSQLASTAQRAASRLDEGGLDAMVADVKRFARNRPGVFIAAAVGAGFVAGRLIKAADTHALIDAAKPDAGSPSNGDAVAPAAQGTIGSGGSMLASDPIVVEEAIVVVEP